MAGYVPATLYQKKGREMKEIWKDVQGFEGVFQVSNWGNVKRISCKDSPTVKLLKKGINYCGYECVNLRNGKTRKSFLVHRLVAKAFIDNPNKLEEVNHKDENKLNNHVNNLEWCNHLENMRYSYSLHPEWKEKGKTKYTQSVVKKDMFGNVIEVYKNSKEASIKNNISKNSIVRCCTKNIKTTHGYIWEFAN